MCVTWTKLFKSFDKDGGGSIDFSEFRDTLTSFGSAGDVESFFKQVDTDGSGELDAEEFSTIEESIKSIHFLNFGNSFSFRPFLYVQFGSGQSF